MNIFKRALCRSQAICNCWALRKLQTTKINFNSYLHSENDVYDFTTLRDNEMMNYTGMDMEQLQNYAYCVSPQTKLYNDFSDSETLIQL